MYLFIKSAIGIIYAMSFVVALVSTGIVLSQRSKNNTSPLGARVGLLAHHGMYGGVLTCNLFNLLLTETSGNRILYAIVVIANTYLYMNIDKLRKVRKYKEILKLI
jgi:hypothetical protein